MMIIIAMGLIFLTAVHCFCQSYVGKQPVAWKEYFAAPFQEMINPLVYKDMFKFVCS